MGTFSGPELWASEKKELENTPCGICKKEILQFLQISENNYRFSCRNCSETIDVEIEFLYDDYHIYPEDIELSEKKEYSNKCVE